MTDPTDQLPAIIQPGALTPMPDGYLVPALIADAGEAAGWRYIDFFTSNIRNANTRRAYVRACNQFFAWCENRGLTLTTIRPFDVATYIYPVHAKTRESKSDKVALMLEFSASVFRVPAWTE